MCHRGTKLDAKEVEASLKTHPIPWLSRYGWTFLIALIIGVGALGSIDGERRQSQMSELLRTPRPNDLYVVNMAKLLKEPEASFMYGVMRVKSVQGTQVVFDMPNVSYNKAKGATKDIQSGKVSGSDYFAPKPLLLTTIDVQSLKNDGAIHSVEQN
ncbi:MAG: hypothetical protein U1E89_13670 [Burkholderiaceae bacterium]